MEGVTPFKTPFQTDTKTFSKQIKPIPAEAARSGVLWEEAEGESLNAAWEINVH